MALTALQNLYTYRPDVGVIIPDTGAVKEAVQSLFRDAYGADFDLTEETPQGRIIEALTLWIVDAVGVTAQNANSFNPNQAMGAYLDAIGGMFGVQRGVGMTDDQYRQLIISAKSRAMGYAESIRNALSKLPELNSICVIENGEADPAMLPRDDDRQIAVSPHSVFICVNYGEDESGVVAQKVADAINATISAGCAFSEQDGERGTKIAVEYTVAQNGYDRTIVFYKPDRILVRFEVDVRADVYTGIDIRADVRQAVAGYVNERNTNHVFSTGEIISAIVASGKSIVCTAVRIKWKNPDDPDWHDDVKLVLKPYQYAIVSSEASSSPDIVVNVV